MMQSSCIQLGTVPSVDHTLHALMSTQEEQELNMLIIIMSTLDVHMNTLFTMMSIPAIQAITQDALESGRDQPVVMGTPVTMTDIPSNQAVTTDMLKDT